MSSVPNDLSEYLSIYKENVLIGDEGRPLITDFALAKVRYVNSTFICIAKPYYYNLKGT